MDNRDSHVWMGLEAEGEDGCADEEDGYNPNSLKINSKVEIGVDYVLTLNNDSPYQKEKALCYIWAIEKQGCIVARYFHVFN